jgi:hypothetical protein
MPWIGYFDLIDRVNLFIFLDTAQLVRRSFDVRNRIKTSNGELSLTIPVKKTKNRDDTKLCEAEIDYREKWIKKHLSSIELAYKKSKFFNEVFPIINDLYNMNYTFLSDFTINIIKNIAIKIGIKTPLLKSSELSNIYEHKDELLVSICKETGCNSYLSARGSAVYIESEKPGGEFTKNGIKLYYHNFEHPYYNQLYGGFLPFMGIFDLIFNEGFEKSLEIIRSGRREQIDYQTYRDKYLIKRE